jgi:hypothetical protein
LLDAAENGPQDFHDSGVRRLPPGVGFGFEVPEEDLWSGLEACLRHGWLRILDRQVIDDIHTLLRNDSALLAVPKRAKLRPVGHDMILDPANPGQFMASPLTMESRWGEIDFSEAGAALYRMISAEYLEPGWEDNLVASRRYYVEEHLYCETEDGFRIDVQALIAQGSVIQARRLVSIGPWCVHWWERFPSGYRLELEVGAGH